MQIHELNTLEGTPGGTDFLPIDTGFDTAKISAKDLLKPVKDEADKIEERKVNSPLDENNQPDYGTAGQTLRTKGDGSTEWSNVGQPTDEQTAQAVSDWLDAHPEATTTVADGSLTETKFSSDLKKKTIKEYVTPYMFGAKGDGVTNDTQAFKDMLASGVDIIMIPEGNFYIDDTLVFPTGKEVTCAGLLEFHGVLEAVVLGDTDLNKFNINSLRITSDVYDEASVGIKIVDCIESNFSNLYANKFGTNIYVLAVNGVNAYNTFINPVATRGKYNFKVYGPSSPRHCNENYVFGGRLFSSNDTLRQMSIEGYAGSWAVVGLSAEGSGECAIYCDTGYCTFYQIRTEGTWTEAGIVFGSHSDRCRAFSTRYDGTIKNDGEYNTYLTNRMGTRLISSTSNVPALDLFCPGGAAYSAISIKVNGIERFVVRGDNTIESFVMHITQSGWNFAPFKIGANRFWIKDNVLWTKGAAPSSDTDGSPVGREYRDFYQSPVGVLTPKFIGDEVFDSTNKKWYKSTGTTVNDWVALN